MISTRISIGIATLLLSGVSFAQYGTPETLKAEVTGAADLTFANEAKEFDASLNLSNSMVAPRRGEGEKLPALVLLPTCGGITQHIRDWAGEANKAGYVVLVTDSLRGLQNDCGSPSKISNGRYIKDALDAVAHLAKQPYVDSKHISVLGFSKGALVATWLASSNVASTLRPGTPAIAAAISMYGFCALGPTRGRPQGIQILQPDTDRPLLLLMGGQDTELPPASCIDRLPKLKESGAPVQWHVYPEATHAWDKSEQNGFTKVDFKGERVTYRYDKTITEDSRTRVVQFLSKLNSSK
jgi:dienelactone hydrolase